MLDGEVDNAEALQRHFRRELPSQVVSTQNSACG
jgi:hypothetical protein